MADKIKTNFSLLQQTIDGIIIIKENTFRDKGDIIDWLVDDHLKQHPEYHPAKIPLPQSTTVTE